MIPESTSRNFSFLLLYERQLDRLSALAERYFADDPGTALIKLRQFGEELARQTAARNGLLTAPDEPQSDLLRRLKFERAVPPEVLDLFHQVRIVGNRAAHAGVGEHRHALTTLKRALGYCGLAEACTLKDTPSWSFRWETTAKRSSAAEGDLPLGHPRADWLHVPETAGFDASDRGPADLRGGTAPAARRAGSRPIVPTS